MLTRALALTIPGHPAPKGSMRCVGARGKKKHVLLDQLDRTKPWVDRVAAAVARSWPRDQRVDEDQAVQIYATFSLPRPGYHYGTGRNVDVLKDQYWTAVPTGANSNDVDKLARAVLDGAQQGGLLHNDSQVVDLVAVKRFLLPERQGDVLTRPGVVLRVQPFVLPHPNPTLLTAQEG